MDNVPATADADSLLQSCLAQVEALHRHLCPRQVLGVRMGLLGARLLGVPVPQGDRKRLYVFMETDGCAADGVSVATGCWVGRRTMRIIDHGKVAATFVDRETGNAVRVHPHPDSRAKARALFPEARSRWHAMLKAYQQMPEEDLLVAEPVALLVDLEAIISRPGVRARCERCGEEVINEREVQRDGVTLCRGCAGEAYFRPLP